jgi:hypothetical protein
VLVICYGIPKSGSTLAYELVRGVLKSTGFEQKIIVNDARGIEGADAGLPGLRNFVAKVDRQMLEGLLKAAGPDNKLAIKTHSMFPDTDFAWIEERQRAGDIKIIASYRDPRDICLSLMDAASKAKKRGFDAFIGVEMMRRAQRNVRHRIKDFRKWAAISGAIRLGYDTVAFAPDEALDRIEGLLSVKCSDREEIKDYVYYEAPTQKNKGLRNRYKRDLTEEQNADMLEKFGEIIRIFSEDDQNWFDVCRRKMLAGATE